MLEINTREYRRGNQKWIIQRNWQHRVLRIHKTKKNKAKIQHNMWIHLRNINIYSLTFKKENVIMIELHQACYVMLILFLQRVN